MRAKLILQKNEENTLSDSIIAAFERKPKKAYFLLGDLKETGFRIIEEELIDNKLKLFFAIGIDKKNTTRSMLEDMLTYTKNVYYYSNNDVIEFDSNLCIFEYDDFATMYVASSNISENGLKSNISCYTEVIYDLKSKEEKEEYKNQIKNITDYIEKDTFIKLDKNIIEELVNNKEIFTTRQYNHSVMSISELLGKSPEAKEEKKGITKQEIDDVYVENVEIPKIDLSDMSIDLGDIDFSSMEEVEIEKQPIKKKENSKKEKEIEVDYDKSLEQIANFDDYENEEQFETKIDKSSELYDETLADMSFDENETLDINNMLFEKADVTLDVESKKKTSVEEEVPEETNEFEDGEVVQGKKVNLNNVTNFIFELHSKVTRGNDTNAIKIPSAINKMIPDFFEFVDNSKNIEIDGSLVKVRNIKLEVVDVKTGAKYTDREAKMMLKSSQSYFTFNTDVLNNIDYLENDIVRIIKLSSDIYHIEIISKDLQEYKLWNKLCTQNFKASTRKYGIM